MILALTIFLTQVTQFNTVSYMIDREKVHAEPINVSYTSSHFYIQGDSVETYELTQISEERGNTYILLTNGMVMIQPSKIYIYTSHPRRELILIRDTKRYLELKMKKTAKYYKTHPEARRKKAEYDKEFNKKPDQRRKRSELNQENRRRGTYGNGDDLDLSHTRRGLVKKPQSVNRASKSDQPGDRRSRGGS